MNADKARRDILFESTGDIANEAGLIQDAERRGIESAWIHERAGDPFLALTLAAAETSRIKLGAIVAAFPRSPMVTAQIAWDLARQSGGRFQLGLSAKLGGNQAQSDADELGRMQEYLESLRAIWDTFQNDARLRYRGQHYTFRLMAPFFNPGPISHPDIPVYLAGESEALCELAGKAADGLIAAHPQQLAEAGAALKRGRDMADRPHEAIKLIAPTPLTADYSSVFV